MAAKVPNLIIEAGITAKDAPGNILKKIKKYDLQFFTNSELEIKACLSRHYLPFDEFSAWLNDAYLRYIIINKYIYSATHNSTCLSWIEHYYVQSLQQLRKCSPKVKNPLGLLFTIMAEIWEANYSIVKDYLPGFEEKGDAEMQELDFDKKVSIESVTKQNKFLQTIVKNLDGYSYPFEDAIVFKMFPILYAVWLQAVLAWETPDQFLRSLLEQPTVKTKKSNTNLKVKNTNQTK
jgi:hypothetical protein